jgi:hypothetical protein
MTTFPNLDAALAAHDDKSFRVKQRVCAFFLGLTQGSFAQKELRELCKARNAIHPPTFARSLAQDSEFFAGSRKEGFVLTEKGKVEAEAMFGTSGVSADEGSDDCACDGDPDEDEAAFNPECSIHAIEPETETETEPEPEVAQEVAPTEPQSVAAAIVAPPATQDTPPPVIRRPPRVRGTQMLAALFHRLEEEGQDG